MRPEKMALWNEFLPDQLVEEQTTESPKPTTTEEIPDDKKGEDFFVNFNVKLPRILANFGFLKCHDIHVERGESVSLYMHVKTGRTNTF